MGILRLDDNLSYVMDLIINALKKVIYVNPKVIENSLIEKLSNGDEDLSTKTHLLHLFICENRPSETVSIKAFLITQCV